MRFAIALTILGALAPLVARGDDEPALRFADGRLRHREAVQALAFSPDGSRLASCGPDGLRVWDTATLACVLSGTTAADAVAFSPDGASLAAVSNETLAIVEVATGRTRPAGSGGSFVAWPTAEVAVVGSVTTFRFVAPATGATLRTVTWDGNSGSLAVSPDGKVLAWGGEDGVVAWEGPAGRKTAEALHEVLALAFSPDGKRLAHAGYGEVAIVDVAMSSRIVTLDEGARELAFSPDGRLLASVDKGCVRLHDAASGRLVRELVPRSPESLDSEALAFSRDGATIAVARERAIELVDVKTGVARPGRDVPRGTFSAVAFAPTGELVFTEAPLRLHVASVATGKLLRVIDGSEPVFAPGGQRIAVKMSDHVALVDLTTGRREHELPIQYFQRPVAFTPDGRVLVTLETKVHVKTGTQSVTRGDVACRTWDVSTGAPGPALEIPNSSRLAHDSQAVHVASIGSGCAVATAAWGKISLWRSLGAKRETFETPARSIGALEFSPDGAMLVTVDPMADPRRVLRVFDLASRQPIREVPYEGARPTLAFGAGRTFAWSGERGDVGFVPGLGAPVTLAEGHDPSGTWAPGIAFSPDGRRFAYATEGTVHVVPVDGGSERALAARGVRLALDLAFSPDGRWLAAASIDDVLVWRVD